MSQKIFYISGLARSGTTFFGYTFAKHFKLFLAGEVIANREIFMDHKRITLYETASRRCSCGEEISCCNYWNSDSLDKDHEILSFDTYYMNRLYHADKLDKASTSRGFVDTSKSTARLWQLIRSSDSQNKSVYVIHIFKHYRAQVYSYHKYHRNKNLVSRQVGNLIAAIYWVFSNLRSYFTLRYLSWAGLIEGFSIIAYEDVVFQPNEVFTGLQFKAGLNFVPGDQIFTHHEMGGNEGFKEDTQRLVYNHKWLNSSSLLSPLLWIFLEPVYIWLRSVKLKT